jgi:hypothetical protein
MRGQTVGWTSVVAILGFLVPPAYSQAVTTAQNQTIRVSGIFSGSFYAQDADFLTGNGQRAEFPSLERKNWEWGGDVRNLRVALGISGPEIRRAWRANATLELDFFGNLVGTGDKQDEQPEARLRLAYVDLTNGRTTLRVGQAWSLTFGNVPLSLSHLTFPLGYGSGGVIGWRFPGVWLIKTLSRPNATRTTQLSVAVMRNSWSDEVGPPDPFSAGERGTPQIEGRLDIRGRNSSVYVVGHVDKKDSLTVADSSLTSWALQVGGSLTRGDLTIQGNAHVGQAMAHHFAQILQFGEIKGWGGWVQGTYNLNPRLSASGYYGLEQPNARDLRRAAPAVGCGIGIACLRTSLAVYMLRYHSGPYAAGLEWLYGNTTFITTTTSREFTRKGNQLIASVRYDF